jgi:hypothetical protein
MTRLKNELDWLTKYNPELGGDDVTQAKNFW